MADLHLPGNAALEALRQWLATLHPDQQLLVGCSGGMDSLMLTIWLGRLWRGRVRAVHVNHQLHPDAADWSVQVSRILVAEQIPCSVIAVRVDPGNLEAAARQARYQAMTDLLAANEWLVLAHHAQDQAETVLQRLIRGSGVTGLAAMRPISVQQHAGRTITLTRPLLQVSRTAIRQLADLTARTDGYNWVEDPANQDPRFDRVWLRQQWPQWEQRWPQWEQSLGLVAQRMQDADQILCDMAQLDQARCLQAAQICQKQQAQAGLWHDPALSEARVRNVLYHWTGALQHEVNAPPFNQHWLLQLQQLPDKQAIRLGHWAFLRWQGCWWARPADWEKNVWQVTVPVQPLRVPQAFRVGAQSGYWQPEAACMNPPQQNDQQNGSLCLPGGQSVLLTARQGGERLRLHGRAHTISLKKWLQSGSLSPWQRQACLLVHLADVAGQPQALLGVLTAHGWFGDALPMVPAEAGQPSSSSVYYRLVFPASC